MTDYDATLSKFFDEVKLFLNRQAQRAKDVREYERVIKNIEFIEKVQENPRKYAGYNARVADGVVEDSRAFMVGTRDNSVFLLYTKMLFEIENLFSDFDYQRRQAQLLLERSLKTMKYKNSTNVFKDFLFPFIPANKFNVKVNMQKTK